MQLRGMVFAAMLLAPGLAAAQMPLPSAEPAPPLNGLYIGAGVGLNWLQNEHLINAAGIAADASISSHLGMVGVHQSAMRCRMACVLNSKAIFATTRSTGHMILASPPRPAGGSVSTGRCSTSSTTSRNLIPVPYFAPYLGVGVGYQWARMSGLHVNGTPTGFPAFTSGDTTGAIAYQFILGGAMPIPVSARIGDDR